MFKSYEECVKAARLAAREAVSLGCPADQAERGVEFNALFKTWSHFGLPKPGNRYGHELRCEVVKPSDPL